MTTREDYTLEEWKTLYHAPVLVAGAVAAATYSGFFGTLWEALSVNTSIIAAANQFPLNELIQDVVFMQREQHDKDIWTRLPEGTTHEQEEAQMRLDGINGCHRVVDLLKQKTSPSESAEFRRWLLLIGERMAAVSKEGRLFGLGAPRISPGEREFLGEIALVLRVPYTPDVTNSA